MLIHKKCINKILSKIKFNIESCSIHGDFFNKQDAALSTENFIE
jgi:hypothetical protein